MKGLAAVFASLVLTASASAQTTDSASSQGLKIRHAGSQPSGKGPADYFTGAVRVDPPFPATAPSRAQGGRITFEPGARTAWHTLRSVRSSL
jgi:quercetin dioxygenase-like cupin family protein